MPYAPLTRLALVFSAGALVVSSADCASNRTPTMAGPPPAAITKAAGDAQTGPVAQPLPTPITVQVSDSQGAAQSGVTVTWVVMTGAGSVGTHSSVTDGSGQASTSWTLGPAAGSNSVSATVTGLPPVTFDATGTPGPAAALSFSVSPSGAVAGASFSPAVVVVEQDAHGNAVAASQDTVRLSIATGSGAAGAALSGTTSRVASAAGASFANLSIDNAATGYRLSAAATGRTGATSAAFTVTAAAAAAVTMQAGDGQSASAGTAVATPPAVLVSDAFSNPKPGVSVTFAVASGGGSVSGASRTTGSDGVATVGGWTLGASAGANTLTATASGSGISGNPVTFTATGTSGGGGGGGGGGGTVLFQESFADANLASRGWYDTPTGSGVNASAIDATQHIPGATASLKMSYSPGSSTPSPSVAMRHKFTPTDAVYLRYWVKYDSSWVGSGLSYHPHEFYLFTTDDNDYVSPAANHLTVYVEHNWHSSGTQGGYASINTQDATNIDANNINTNLVGVTENRAVSGCNGVADAAAWTDVVPCYQNGGWENERIMLSPGPVFLPNPGPGYKADWNLVEVYIKLNSIVGGIGQQDGVIQYWFDSTLVIDKHNILFRTGAHPTMQFDQLFIGPYMDQVPHAERAWIDGLVVATARP
jgi:hypothetical protein